MHVAVDHLIAHVDLSQGEPLASWRWLVEGDAAVMLVTALGDAFFQLSSGEIAFLDTYEGTCEGIAADKDGWEAALQNIDARFSSSLVEELQGRGLRLGYGQCYSPVLHPAVGGSMDPDNFEVSPWLLHVALAGQLHEQNTRHPDGTRIAKFVER